MASTLIIPVENQVRELDAKLLLACIAVERGYPVIIGSRTYCHFEIASMSRGVYMAKSTRSLSNLMFRMIRMLGHDIVCWEEEALVHPPGEIFYSLRLSPVTIKLVSHIFAWGQENAELIKGYEHLPEGVPVHITGNPRGDMLRSEFRPYFDEDVRKLKEKYDDFILINTNFSDVNPFIPAVGLFLPSHRSGESPRFGQAGKGMTLEFAEGLRDHKQQILDAFNKMIPELQQHFPDMNIVIRPHPSEKCDVYNQLAGRYDQIFVTNEGNIIPWLLATKVMVHNGCTTGMEAYRLQVPAVSYLPDLNKYYDYDFQGMPTKLSHQCFNMDELKSTLNKILKGGLGAADGEERRQLLDHYLHAQDGLLACERILDVMDESGYVRQPSPVSPMSRRSVGWLYTKVKAWLTQLNMHRPGPNRKAYHDHRFPEITAEDMQKRVNKFGKILNRFESVIVEPHSRHLFKINRKETLNRHPEQAKRA